MTERIDRWLANSTLIAFGYVWAKYGLIWVLALNGAIIIAALSLFGVISMVESKVPRA